MVIFIIMLLNSLDVYCKDNIISSFSEVSKKVLPATVGISSYGTSKSLYNNNILEFIGKYIEIKKEDNVENVKIGEGSGFIISENGYIITNKHVIDRANRIVVTNNEGKEYEGELVFKAEYVDLAVLKIKSNDKFNFLNLATSNSIKTGDIVLAFGSPYGFSNSMTFGIVSATERNKEELLKMGLPHLIQTSAPIYEGSSGGPLTNINGEVVGINSVMVTNFRNAGSIGFAIPIDFIKDIISSLNTRGSFTRGYLGIKTIFVKDKGVIVEEVYKNTPAYKIGIKKGDLILSFEGKSIENNFQLNSYISLIPSNAIVKIKIKSNNKIKELKIKLAEYEEDIFNFQGISIKNNKDKLLIEKVDLSRVYSRSLKKDDILASINGIAINNVKEFIKIYKSIKDNSSFLLEIKKTDKIIYVELIKKAY